MNARMDIDKVVDSMSDPSMRGLWEGRLAEALDAVTATFARLKLPSEQAERLATAAVITLAWQQGGRAIYWPKGKELEEAIRDNMIYRAYERHRNMDVLAAEHGLCTERVRQIVRRQESIRYARQQLALL